MKKRVILITGTPCTGKTTLAKKLAQELEARYVNLTDLAKTEHLTLGTDEERQTTIIDEDKMRKKLAEIIKETTDKDIIVDGHYAAAVTPKRAVTQVFVLRRNPLQLREFMQECGFNTQKQNENLTAEILDVCLVEALRSQSAKKVCEIDATNKTPDETLSEIRKVLEGKQRCGIGCVDWLSILEKEGKTDEFLKP